MTQNPLSLSEGNYADSIGWQHRLTASRDESEKGIWFTWIDTKNTYNQIENLQPDLFGWNYCHSDPIYSNSGTIDYTEGTLYEGFYFFTNTYEQVIYDNDIFAYTLAVLQAVSPADYADNDVNQPVTFSYISGLDNNDWHWLVCGNYSQCLLTGNDDVFEPSHFEMTQNAPNPFSTETTIRIISQKQISGTLELHDLLGQKMMEIETGPIYGSADFIISSENLRSGIYFYSFVSENIRVSKKMIIN